jgi:hypothetical protein
MTAKAAFEPDEWKLVEEGPTSAAMLVIVSQRGGTFRETLAIGKEYAEARRQHGQSSWARVRRSITPASARRRS